MNDKSMARRTLLILTLLVSLSLFASCPTESRMPYQKGIRLYEAQNYGEALTEIEKSLAEDPEQNLALFYKARCLYELERYEEAIPAFEEFLSRTQTDRTAYGDERFDAEFYRDKAKQELGQEVPQNEEAIPEPRMRL